MDLSSLPLYDDSNFDQLVVGPKTEDGAPECLPRRTVCGSPLATGSGMVPVLDFPDMLPDPKDFKEIVTYCHAQKIFPMYHRLASGLPQKPSQNGFGHCFPAGTLIRMEDGSQKPIETLTVQDTIVSAEGCPQPVMQVMRRWHVGKIGVLKLWGHGHLRATPEHPILTQRGYVPLEQLKPGEDWVAIPKYAAQASLWLMPSEFIDVRQYVGKSFALGIPGKRAVTITRQRMPDIIHLTRAFGRLIGLFLAEGHTTQGRACWSYNASEETTLVAETIRLLKTTLGIDARVARRNARGTVLQVIADSTECAKVFEQLCGHRAEGKYIHPRLTSGPLEFLEGVLTGWIDGDKQRANRGVTVSSRMAMNMYDIANALNRRPVIGMHTKPYSSGGVNHRRSWAVGWFDRPRAKQDDKTLWQRVRGVDYGSFEGWVYNLEVANDHSYIAEGVGVHNCWNYGITHATEDCRAAEGQPAVKLAPNSLAYLVNWRNQGYFCDETIAAVRQYGIAPASMVPEYKMDPREFDPKWEQERLKYRVLEWWDTRRSDGVIRMIQQCLAVLMAGRAGYIARNWWGHALESAGMEWDEHQPNNVVWIDFNSHGDGLIRLAGSKGIPDEFYGVRAGSLS